MSGKGSHDDFDDNVSQPRSLISKLTTCWIIKTFI